MVAKSKLYSKLDGLEIELKERLVPHLEQAAAGNNDLVFCVKGYHSFNQLKSHTEKTMEDLVDIGAQILSLKEKLGEPSDGSIAERICWYCREWGNAGNHHRQSAQGLAKQFLNEIR
ncbi:MAG: hypothetical protein ACI8PG_005321 [Planctomycetota bacterium]|jgi:hypothetical protein